MNCTLPRQQTMLLFTLLALLLLSRIKGVFVNCEEPEPERLLATLGEPLTLSCTYNCSAGWIRGYWHLERTGAPACTSCLLQETSSSRDGNLCTARLSLRYASVSPAPHTYTCYSEESDSPQLGRRAERRAAVWLQALPSTPVVRVTPHGPVLPGNRLTVTCATRGFYPRNVTITWSLNGSAVARTDDLTTTANADGTFSTHSALTLTPSASHHGLLLTCAVHHASLTRPLRGNITLEVKYLSLRVSYSENPVGKAKDLQPPHTVRVRVGASLRLHCLADSNPRTTGQWVRGNVTTSWQNADTAATLTWHEIKEEDAGSYRCQASTLYQTSDVIITVQVEKSGEFSWLKVLAATTVIVATVLAAMALYFSLSSRRKSKAQLPVSTCKSMTSEHEVRAEEPPAAGDIAMKRDHVAVTVISADSQSDHEVPYADIMISVRGSSTPEVTRITDQSASRDHRQQRWKEEAGSSGLLQVSRSADRLHVHQREVNRKMSTSSEYAIIHYPSEPIS
ncbi:hypothetical protein MATL_G00123840 [Megalops atlanticus]|uniref:Ig-like domain-containing protein n=1 Tax=Megalops atlanticus TaxID=7932 RepID=A0A9D3T570_MEGAT|nr:hypothetical protein MATL_G00123840 [Megalops atlanticus]